MNESDRINAAVSRLESTVTELQSVVTVINEKANHFVTREECIRQELEAREEVQKMLKELAKAKEDEHKKMQENIKAVEISVSRIIAYAAGASAATFAILTIGKFMITGSP